MTKELQAHLSQPENRIRYELYATILRSQQSLVSQAIIHDR